MNNYKTPTVSHIDSLTNIIWPFKYFVYVLQKEEYKTTKYFTSLPNNLTKQDLQYRNKLRKNSRNTVIIRTSQMLYTASTILILACLIYLRFITGEGPSATEFVVALFLGIILIPVHVGIANIFIVTFNKTRGKH